VQPIINDQDYSRTMSVPKLKNWKSKILPILLLAIVFVSSAAYLNNRYHDEKWRIELFEAQHLARYIYSQVLTPNYPIKVANNEFNSFFSLENSVGPRRGLVDESVIEQELSNRVTQALVQLNLSIVETPFFDMFPPVTVELAIPPKYLVISPRSRIEHMDGYLLKQDLSLKQIKAIEKNVEASGENSAYAVKISGIATYPALIDDNLSYQRTVFAVAHEWIHHYLAFFNLGRIYFSEGTAINETVADIAAREITDMVLRNYPPAHATTEQSEGEPFDFKLLQELRRDVDALLLAQDVATAEELMTTMRLAWCEQFRWCPRRINQAYLAWVDQYAAQDGSKNIVGQQLIDIRLNAKSLHDFLIVVREIESEEGLLLIRLDNIRSD